MKLEEVALESFAKQIISFCLRLKLNEQKPKEHYRPFLMQQSHIQSQKITEG